MNKGTRRIVLTFHSRGVPRRYRCVAWLNLNYEYSIFPMMRLIDKV